MKFSLSLILVLVCSCVLVVAKHQTRTIQDHKNERSISKTTTDTFDSESLKNTINSGADTLSRAIDDVAPLVRNAFTLGSDLATRIVNGNSETKEDRANDANLLARVDSLIADSSEAYSRWAAPLAQRLDAAAKLMSAAKAADNLISLAKIIHAKYIIG